MTPQTRIGRTRSYRKIGATLILTTRPIVYIWFVSTAGLSMQNTGNVWPWNWRRNITDVVDVLIGGCVFFVAYATVDGAADWLDLLIAGVIALVGIGLMLEPAAAQPIRDVGSQPARPSTGPSLGEPGTRQWGDGFDATIAEAMSL